MLRRVLIGFATVSAAVLFTASPAARAASAHVDGPCEGSGTFASNGMKVSAAEEGVVTVPLTDSVAWEGSITGPSGDAPYDGEIAVQMPWPLPDLMVDTWSGTTDSLSNSGKKHYDLPGLTPRGVEIDVTGFHDQGTTRCSGHVTIEVAGGAFDSPFAPASLVGTVLFGAGFAYAGKAKGGALG